jgi:hypothetical protein
LRKIRNAALAKRSDREKQRVDVRSRNFITTVALKFGIYEIEAQERKKLFFFLWNRFIFMLFLFFKFTVFYKIKNSTKKVTVIKNLSSRNQWKGHFIDSP